MHTTNTQPLTHQLWRNFYKFLINIPPRQFLLRARLMKKNFCVSCRKIQCGVFFSMSQDEYLLKSKEERVSLISRYYTEISNSENNLFFVWLLVLFLGRLRLPFTPFFFICSSDFCYGYS